jgi:hypothetical protein
MDFRRILHHKIMKQLRRILIIAFPIALFTAVVNFAAPAFAEKHTPAAIANDTCFYSINVPADMDMPSTPSFDTTIVRTTNCKIHLLKLPGWGTETEYKLSGNNIVRSTHFSTGSGPGLIDITDLVPGTYAMSLLACGNGGAFTVRIK